ncbi:MAG TPA: radical SAM protein [Candidatus Krumholzibacteria bacterium]|nr:radical SAM protein [Candidatus Krumholzibacteria bacterium]
MRAVDAALSKSAEALWPVFQFANNRLKPGKPFQPRWAPAALPRSWERSFPKLGWPRETDSLCPQCVKEVRAEILADRVEPRVLVEGNPGEIKATVIERDGKVLMVKDCPKHGRCEDVMAIDPAFLSRIERLYPGRDFKSPTTELRQHGTSSIQYGRGAVLTIDLTNRCNMMCDPCFMDANQVGYVHELSFADVQKILDDSLSIQPRRQMSVQFSGGEPTVSPIFLESVAYAKKVGYFSIQAATNGIRFAQDLDFAYRAREAGMRLAYLQFDGTDNASNAHRKIGNLFDVKLRAIDNLAKADIDVVLVVTIVKTINDDQVGPIIDFAIENSDKISVVSFQPVSFTGRDEDISDADRERMRYTLSHLAHDVKNQTGATDPLVDWYPLSGLGPFSDMVDLMKGAGADWGSLKCGCHPNCGIGTILFVNTKTKQMVPVSEFLNLERLLADVRTITDANRGRALTKAQLALALLRNFDAQRAPLSLKDFLKKFDKQSGGHAGFDDQPDYDWRVLFVAGMWFQDLFNYDFRRTEMCIIPYGTQQGEISFCAYNTGVGWRQIVEHMHMNATTAEWYKQHGKHGVYASGKDLALPMYDDPVTTRVPQRRPQQVTLKLGGNGNGNGNGNGHTEATAVQAPSGVGCGTGCGCG